MRLGRAFTVGVVVALTCLAPVAASPAAAGLPAVGSCTADADLKLGDSGPGVICLQFALGMMGMYDRAISGTFDEATFNGVSYFQGLQTLRIDGVGGARTLEAMGIWSGKINGIVDVPCTADATIKPADQGPSVLCLQKALLELGIYQGLATAINDTATVEALKAYQAKTPPLQVDGWAGPRTLAAMGIWSGHVSTPGEALAGIAPGANYVSSGTAPPGPWPAGIQAEPEWRLTAEGLPVYGNRLACSLADANTIAYQFARDGADVETQRWAVYVATREGGCRYAAVNLNLQTQDDSHCTFQLNALAGMFRPDRSLGKLGWNVDLVKSSMEACADAASDLWVLCGRGPWTPPYSCRPPWRNPAAGVPSGPSSVVTVDPAADPAGGG